jgi:hypothetical protein
MADTMTDPIEARLRAARPPEAAVADNAFDAELLVRVQAVPRGPVRRGRLHIALPAAAAVVAAMVVLTAGSGQVASPASAAITQALRWFDPAPGTILHFRSELRSGDRTLVQEIWQSADDPERQRHIERDGDRTVETAGGDVYDPATNTIYEAVPPGPALLAQRAHAIERKIAAAKEQGAPAAVVRRLRADARREGAGTLGAARSADLPAGDPTVMKIRLLLRRGTAVVRGHETHDGVDAWAIGLLPGPAAGPRWTLWTAVSDGRPLELRIDRGRGTPIVESTRWTTYEMLPASAAGRVLTLSAAHPDAAVVRDPDRLAAAQQRLFPNG